MEAKDFERLQFWEYLNLMEVPLVVCAPFTAEILEICAKCHALSAQVLVGGDSSNGEAIDGVCLCPLHYSMACVYAAFIVQVTVAAGVPRDAKPIVSGGILSRLVEFPRFLSLLVVIVLFLFVTLLHVTEYENAFPGLRLVKTALYDTMLLSFRLPALV